MRRTSRLLLSLQLILLPLDVRADNQTGLDANGDGLSCKQPKRLAPTLRHHGKQANSSIPYYVGKYVGATKMPYGGHYSFYQNIDKIMRQHVMLYKNWHPHGMFLDVGGRNGENSFLAKGYKYAILERDMPNAKAQQKFKHYACDLYDCKLDPCLVEIIYCNNVLEHLLKPHDAMISMARLLKPGGMLLLKTQWLWRYHATTTYGDYFRYSARALEYLCIQAKLNPVWSGYAQMGQSAASKVEVGGAPGDNDVPPVRLPLETQYPSFIICYKPRVGERQVAFEEVGSKHVSVHPRFNLVFNEPRSEAAAHS
jgi:SAM-dependent methyltransferase